MLNFFTTNMPLSINFDWETILEQMEDLSFLLFIPLNSLENIGEKEGN